MTIYLPFSGRKIIHKMNMIMSKGVVWGIGRGGYSSL